jgi:hypothetical protein
MDYKPDLRSVAEGDDVPDERPIRIILYGGQFVSTDDSETLGMRVTGPDALATPAIRLFQAGFDPERPPDSLPGRRARWLTTKTSSAALTGPEIIDPRAAADWENTE